MKREQNMKYMVIVLLLVLFRLSAAGQKPLREVDLRVNGVGTGSSFSTVIRRLGWPLRRQTDRLDAAGSCSNTPETHLTLKYQGLEVTLLGDGKGRQLRVYSVDVTSKKWLASGVRIGTGVSRVRKRFGKPVSQAEAGGKLIYYYVTPGNFGGVNFEFKRSKLIRMRLNESLC